MNYLKNRSVTLFPSFIEKFNLLQTQLETATNWQKTNELLALSDDIEVKDWYENHFKQLNYSSMDVFYYLNQKYSSSQYFNELYSFLIELEELTEDKILINDDIVDKFSKKHPTVASFDFKIFGQKSNILTDFG